MREPFLTRLESTLAERIERRAKVFGSNSDFLRLVVRIFFKLEDAGIIRTDLTWLQAVLEENQENVRNRVASAAREPVPMVETLRGQTPSAQRNLISRRQAATWEWARERTSILPLNFTIRKIAIGCGARP